MHADWTSHDRLLLSLLIASLFHALIILAFQFDWPMTPAIRRSLDVVLVVKPAQKSPGKADFLAQAPQKGAGQGVKKAVPSAIPSLVPKNATKKLPLPPTPVHEQESVNPPKPGAMTMAEPQAEEKPVQLDKPTEDNQSIAEENPIFNDKLAPVAPNDPKPVLKQAKSEKKVLASLGQSDRVDLETAHPRLSTNLLSQQIAEVSTEFNMSREAEAKQQRMVYIDSVNAHRYNAAAYEAAWQEKVERIGTLNYPEAARRLNLTGSLVLAVGIKADGSIYSIQVRQSSGEPVLDEAAQQIIRLAAPFSSFPKELREEADVLVITRTWSFSVGNRIETGR